MNPADIIRAGSVELVLLDAILERAEQHRHDFNRGLARLIRNELTDMENRRRKR